VSFLTVQCAARRLITNRVSTAQELAPKLGEKLRWLSNSVTTVESISSAKQAWLGQRDAGTIVMHSVTTFAKATTSFQRVVGVLRLVRLWHLETLYKTEYQMGEEVICRDTR